MRARCLVFLLTLGCGLHAGGPRLDQWRVIGPGGGGSVFHPTVSPIDPSRVLVACDMTGSYLSNDSGDTWRMINLRGGVQFFVFDPQDANTIYAQGIGLWRSTDAGVSWNLVYPDPASITDIRIVTDDAELAIYANGRAAGAIAALAVDPADSHVLYAALRESGVTSLAVSSDGGASWTKTAALADGALKIYVDPASPADNRTIYALGPHAAAVREAGAWTSRAGPGAAFVDVSAGFAGDGTGPVIYGVTGNAIYVSDDGARSWRQSALNGTGYNVPAIATSLTRPDVAYVSYSNLHPGDGSYYLGVARSSDQGHTWNLAWQEASRAGSNIFDAWITARFNTGWAGNPIGLGVAPGNPDICFGTDSGRVMRTTDGGETWQSAYSSKMTDAPSYATNGLDITTNYGIHFDPFDANRMFISYTDIGLFRSEDGGASWMSSTAGVPSRWVNTTYWVEFDPQVEGRMWAAVARTHDLPRPKMWRTTSPDTFEGGVVISDDGGQTWRASSNGIGTAASAITHILLDPASPPDARVLYAAAFGAGVYKSADGGQSWTLKNSGLPATQPFAWRLALGGDGALYLILARRSENGTYGNANDGALYRSTDGAESWTRIDLPTGVNGPNGMAIDPQDASRIYLGVWGRTNPGTSDIDGGVYVSADGGASWRSLPGAGQHVYDVTIDARTGALYATGFESSAFRSDDGGETWQRLRGYNFKNGHRVIPDPLTPELVYITTFGGSVWHGPAAGDPAAPEDIATPGLSLVQ